MRDAGPPSEPSTFRPDLEGLRAVAVLLVLLYHARLPGVSGGYVGVDVFFVLSGFLITGLLVRELTATGRVDFLAFYARRARRLLPAAAVTLIVTVAAAAILLPPVRMPDVTGDVIAAGVYLSNMRFAIQATDYLGSALPPSPVLHYWSLGVEEQFYVFWPALLAVAGGAAFAAGRRETGLRRVTVALAVVLVASFGACLWLTERALPWAFFALPARAWELALGGLLALPATARLVPRRAAPWLGWGGLAMIVASGLLLDDATSFPGTAVLLPTIGSALVIAAGLARRPAPALAAADAATVGTGWRHGGQARRPWRDGAAIAGPGRLLGLPAPRYLGRISYSLYLWHWPFLVLPEAAIGAPIHLPGRLLLAAAAIGAAALSQRFVEEPIRHGRLVGFGTRRALALAGALSIVVATSSLVAGGAAAMRLGAAGPAVGGSATDVVLPSDVAITTASSLGTDPGLAGARPSAASGASAGSGTMLVGLLQAPVPADLIPGLGEVKDDLPVTYSDGCHLEQDATASGDCVYGDAASAVTVVLFGDSHAAQWFPTLERLAIAHHWRLVALTKSRCTEAMVTVWHPIDRRPYAECDTWRQHALARIGSERPDLVVTSSSRAFRFVIDGAPAQPADHLNVLMEQLRATLVTLRQDAGAVVLIGDTPRSTADPPSCLSQHLSDASACAVSYADAVDGRLLAAQARVAGETGVAWIDPTAWVCRSDPCPAVYGRFLIYRDEGHLTATYARGLATQLDAALPRIGP